MLISPFKNRSHRIDRCHLFRRHQHATVSAAIFFFLFPSPYIGRLGHLVSMRIQPNHVYCATKFCRSQARLSFGLASWWQSKSVLSAFDRSGCAAQNQIEIFKRFLVLHRHPICKFLDTRQCREKIRIYRNLFVQFNWINALFGLIASLQ